MTYFLNSVGHFTQICVCECECACSGGMLLFSEYVTLHFVASESEFSSIIYGYYIHVLFHHKYNTNFTST